MSGAVCQCCTNALAHLRSSVLGKDHKDNPVNAPGSTSCLGWWNDSKHCRHLKELLGVEKKRKKKRKGHYSRYCVGNLSNVHTGLSGHHIPDPSPRTILEREKDQTVPSRSLSIPSSRLWRECEVVTVLTTGAVGEKCRAPQEDGGQYAPLMLGGHNFFEMLASAPKSSSRKALMRRVGG